MLRQTQVEPPWHTAETSLADALKPPTHEALAPSGRILVKRLVSAIRDQPVTL